MTTQSIGTIWCLLPISVMVWNKSYRRYPLRCPPPPATIWWVPPNSASASVHKEYIGVTNSLWYAGLLNIHHVNNLPKGVTWLQKAHASCITKWLCVINNSIMNVVHCLKHVQRIIIHRSLLTCDVLLIARVFCKKKKRRRHKYQGQFLEISEVQHWTRAWKRMVANVTCELWSSFPDFFQIFSRNWC